MTMFTRRIPAIAHIVCVAGLLAVVGCSKAESKDDPEPTKGEKSDKADKADKESDSKAAAKPSASASAEPKIVVDSISNGLVEEREFGTVAWGFEPSGVVKADIRDPKGAPIKDGATIELVTWPEGVETKTPLRPIEGTTLWGGSILPLVGDLTPVSYTVVIKDKPYLGTLDVPAVGTVMLVTEASKPTIVIAPDAKAPHGGVIQVVGNDRLEMVSDEVTGEVRVYVLDAELKPVVVGERRITLGVHADQHEIVSLAPSPDGLYMTAGWHVGVDPRRITIGVRVGTEFHAGIVGYIPGVRLVVGIGAPVIRLRVRTDWGRPKTVFVHGEWVVWDEGWRGRKRHPHCDGRWVGPRKGDGPHDMGRKFDGPRVGPGPGFGPGPGGPGGGPGRKGDDGRKGGDDGRKGGGGKGKR